MVDRYRTCFSFMVHVFVLSVGLLGSLPLRAQPDNLASNPGFEAIGTCTGMWDTACPVGYYGYQPDSDAVFAGTTAHESGNRRLTFRLNGLLSGVEQTQAAAGFRINNTIPGQAYQFSAWVKTHNLRGRSLIHVIGRSSRDRNQPTRIIRSSFGPQGYSTWTRLGLIAIAPEDSDSLVFSLAAQTSQLFCQRPPCGEVHFDNVIIQRLGANDDRKWIPPRSNVCADGSFLDVHTETCRTRNTSFGYREIAPGRSYKWLSCSEMSASSINLEIRSFGPAGGTLALAPCRVTLDDDIVVASNVTVRGSGSGRTHFIRSRDWNNTSGTLLRVQGTPEEPAQNVALRDFSIQGSGPILSEMNNIQVGWARNVLLERIESMNAGKSGIHFWSSQNVTVRYVTSHGAVQWHGIGTKDCYIDASLDGNDADDRVSRSECDGGRDRFWTEDVAIHSNDTFNNNGLGIDSHASYAEVAGNDMNENGAASKFPEPAHHVWIHHNNFTDSTREGTKIANQVDLADDTLTPYKQVLYKNRFLNSGSYGIRIHDRAWDIVLIDNRYRNNGVSNRLRIVPGINSDARVFSCPGDESANDGIDGNTSSLARLSSTDQRCDLNRIGDIF